MAELIRFGQSFLRKQESRSFLINHKSDDHDKKAVRSDFRYFGHGSERTSDFGVQQNWADVEALIQSFVRMRHPEALKLRKALKLAAAVEEAGWQPENRSEN